MPELPEVETTVRGLARVLPGRRITSAWMSPEKPINVGSNLAWKGMSAQLAGRTVSSVTRRAKFIVIGFDTGSSLWVHQKMTGHLLVGARPTDSHGEGAIRLRLMLDDGTQVALCDVRRFARVILVRDPTEPPRIKELARLGPEPLGLGQKAFAELFTRRRGMVKVALMDPAFVAGIGNIYADEILHRAHIHPFSRIERLDRNAISRIRQVTRTILSAAIRAGGSSTDDYRLPDGTKGGYQNRHRAYQRTGLPCTLCRQGTIERAFRNGRSSHFCSTHQPLLA